MQQTTSQHIDGLEAQKEAINDELSRAHHSQINTHWWFERAVKVARLNRQISLLTDCPMFSAK